MVKREKIVIIGGGGHAKVVIDAAEKSKKFDICGVVDNSLSEGKTVLSVKVIGKDTVLPKLFKRGLKSAFIGVGSIGNPEIRTRIYKDLKRKGFRLPVIAHPSSIIAQGVELGEGTFVAAGAVINSGTRIGKNAIINTSSSIDHDCVLGDFVHIAPGATLSGGIRIGDGTHIGTGVKVIQSVDIGSNCMVGAGITVRHNMADKEKNCGEEKVVSNKSNRPVFIIAEAGVNHNGSPALAKRLIDAAKYAGADAVKFQTFKAEEITTRNAPMARYQKKGSGYGTQFQMLKKLELSESQFRELSDYCRKRKIMFLSTPFDLQSADFLDGLGVACFKIGSGDLTNMPLLSKVAQFKKPIILSTGMSSLEEVQEAVDVILSCGNGSITLLHCTSSYPAAPEDVNLKAMNTMRDVFGLPVGYSDHTQGPEVALAACALGACVIEKHFTLSKRLKGPDHSFSMEPGEFKRMVSSIRKVEKALGGRTKSVTDAEREVQKAARKSVVASCKIVKGSSITRDMLTVKRPGTGIQPKYLDGLLNAVTKRNIEKDEVLTWEKIEGRCIDEDHI